MNLDKFFVQVVVCYDCLFQGANYHIKDVSRTFHNLQSSRIMQAVVFGQFSLFRW